MGHKLVLLQVVVHLRVHHHLLLLRTTILQRALSPLPSIDLVLGQRQLLLHEQTVRLHLGPAAVTQVGAAATALVRWFLRQRLHLVVQILRVQVLVRLIDDSLSDAARATLLPLIVVERSVDPSLLARPHV